MFVIPENSVSDNLDIYQEEEGESGEEVTEVSDEIFQHKSEKTYINELLSELRGQISFLKNELKSKDEIIKILINDNKSRENANIISQNIGNKNDRKSINSFVKPKKPIKQTAIKDKLKQQNQITHHDNRYQCLSVDNTLNNNNNNGNVNHHAKTKRNKDRSPTESVYIIGDSMVKHVKAFKIKKSLDKNKSVLIRTNTSAITEDMVDLVRPSMRRNPGTVIIHCGTNDLRSEKSPEAIAEEIIKLAVSMKKPSNTIIVSHLVPRGDELKGKGAEVNNHLLMKCNDRNLPSVSHDNIDPTRHLNMSHLHTNRSGTEIMTNNFINSIKE